MTRLTPDGGDTADIRPVVVITMAVTDTGIFTVQLRVRHRPGALAPAGAAALGIRVDFPPPGD